MKSQTSNIAAIDVGTNSIHMVVAKISASGFEVLTRHKVTARLGEGAGDMKTLSESAMDRGVVALRQMKQIADVHQAHIFAVATSAVREAKNSKEFVSRVSKEANIDVSVISGVEEARLIHLGVLQALPLADQRSILIDIGGGSTEVVVFDHTDELFARSFKLGAIRLTNRFFPDGSTHPASVPSCRRFIESTIEPTRREIKKLGHDTAVVSSGTSETLARMCWLLTHNEVPQVLNGLKFSSADLHQITNLIVRTPASQRNELPGMDSGRGDIIVAGALILSTLATVLQIDEFVYSDYALREGVLLDAAQRLDPDVDNDLRNVAIESATKLSQRCDEDPKHSKSVARLACNLFDELSQLYETNVHDRLYLEAAALLANVGLVVSHARHHIHSYYIIRNADLVGFTDREIEIIAQVARYHRKSEPKLQHQQFAQLDADDQETVRFLSGILRIAIGLDRTHDGRTTSVKITRKQDDLQIAVLGKRNTDHELNIYAAHERRQLLQDALHCTIALATKR